MEKSKPKASFDSRDTQTVKRRNEKSKTYTNTGGIQLTILPSINYSFQTFQNPKFRDTMEDMIFTRLNFTGDRSKNLFCVYDGHGGDTCVKLVYDRFPDILSKALKEFPTNIEFALCKAFLRIDKEAKEQQCLDDGSTLTCGFLSNRMLYCANVGDSSCVLVTNDKAKKISYDHKCTDSNEIKRIIASGGKITDNRVEGVIAISRTIGDHDYKGKALISEPSISKHAITDNDKYIILASDGVWDVLKEDDVYKICKEEKVTETIVDKILDEAVYSGSNDNISCIVIALNKGFDKE